jgi:hypothetical protein
MSDRTFYDKDAEIEQAILRWDDELKMWVMLTCGTKEECKESYDRWKGKCVDVSNIRVMKRVGNFV